MKIKEIKVKELSEELIKKNKILNSKENEISKFKEISLKMEKSLKNELD